MQISIQGVLATEKMLTKLSMLSIIVRAWFETGEHDRIMQESFQKNFDVGGRPAWPSLSKSTQESRERLGFNPSGPILVRTGSFMDEITSMKSDVNTTSKSNIAIWGIEQLQGEEAKKFKAHTTGEGGNNSNLPIRRTIGFQNEDAQELTNSLAAFIKRNFL